MASAAIVEQVTDAAQSVACHFPLLPRLFAVSILRVLQGDFRQLDTAQHAGDFLHAQRLQ